MLNRQASEKFIAGYLHGQAGEKLARQWLETYNGQQRVTGSSQYVDQVPKGCIADIRSVIAAFHTRKKVGMAQTRASRPSV